MIAASPPLRIGIAGAGRMGQAIADTVMQHPALALQGLWSRGDDLDALLQQADVIIDFSLPEGTAQVVDAVRRHNTPLVCGVSGLNDTQMAAMQAAAGSVAIVYDRNMSRGIAVLEHSVRTAAASLGAEFTVQISETHHVHKKDAPSGTALKLGEAVAAARGVPAEEAVSYSVERHGEVPGDHEVVLETAAERLLFAHSVTTRQVFADGAVEAALWVAAQAPGLYGMRDVLFAD